MGTKPCTICTRVMALEQFRQYKTGRRAGQRQSRCRQCEQGDKAMRRQDFPNYVRPQSPLCRVMREWKGPVSPAPLLSCWGTLLSALKN